MRGRNPAWRSREALCMDPGCWVFLAGCREGGDGPGGGFGGGPWLSITQEKRGLSTTDLYLWPFVAFVLVLNLQSSCLSLPSRQDYRSKSLRARLYIYFLTDY